jgi:hypothetical protein
MDFLVLAGLNHDLSCTNGTRTHSMDTEHPPTDLAVGSSLASCTRSSRPRLRASRAWRQPSSAPRWS